jgi:RNA polymerase sigma-70 factor (ECF subfamily)
MPLTDVEAPALLAVPAPDPNDVAAVYARYAAPLYRFILRRVGDPMVAEELLQDVFVRMLVGLPQYENRGYPISAWLYRIAACRAIDWLRVNSRRRAESLDRAAEVASTGWPDGENTAADREGEQRTLAAALAQLSERQSAVIRLRFFAELPIAEVARQLDLTLGAVKVLQHRGLTALRHQLITPGAYHPAEAA